MRKKNGFEIKDMAILLGVASLLSLIAIAYMVHLYEGGILR